MIRALILLTLAACAHSVSQQSTASVEQASKATAHAEEQSTASGRTTAGPETITTTVEEYAPPEVRPPAEPASAAEHPAVGPTAILRRTVTVDQRGPVDSSWMASAEGTRGAEQNTSLHVETASKSASKWRVGLSWATKILLAVGLVLALKAGWLGKAWAFVRRFY